MRIKPLLVSTAFASTLFATTALVPDAWAQKGAVYTPSTAWAVTQVGGQGDGAYCALARRFRQGAILTIARNQVQEASLALDFQNPKFKIGESISVILDPGAGQVRRYDVTPASGSAFVVRLGQDEPFFGALEKTGYLRAELGGQSYNFNLADIDAGQSDLDACVAQMTQPAAGNESPGMMPAPAAMPSGAKVRIQQLEAENEKLRLSLAHLKTSQHTAGAKSADAQAEKDIERLRAENNRLRGSLNMVKSGADATKELQAEIAALKAKNSELQQLASAGLPENQKVMVLALTEENRRLQQELDAKAAGAAPSAELTQRLASLEKENAQLHQAIAQKEQAVAPVDTGLQQELAALRAENERLQGRLGDAQMAQGQISMLNTELQKLREDNARLQGQATIAQQDIKTSYEAQIANIERENKRLREAVKNAGSEPELVEQLRERIGQIQNENRLLQETAQQARAQAVQDKEAEIAALKSQINQMLASGDNVEAVKRQLEKAVKERNAYKATARAQREKIAALQDGGADTQGLAALVDDLKARLAMREDDGAKVAEMQSTLAQLSVENSELKSQIEMASAQSAQTVNDAQERIAALEVEKSTLSSKIDEYAAQAEEMKTAMAKIETLQSQNADLQSQLELASLQGGQQTEEASMRLAALETENQRLQEEIEGYAAQAQELQTAKLELEQARAEKDDVLEQLAMIAEVDDATGLKLQAVLAENASLKDEVARVAQLDEKVQILAAENAELQSAIEQQQFADATDAQQAIDELKAENLELSAQIASLESEAPSGDVDQKIAELQATNAKINGALDDARADIMNYQEKLAAQNTELAGLREEAQYLTAALNGVETAAGGSELTPEQHAQLADMSAEVEGLRAENAVLRQHVSQAENELTRVLASYTPSRKPDVPEAVIAQDEAQGEIPAQQLSAAPAQMAAAETVATEPEVVKSEIANKVGEQKLADLQDAVQREMAARNAEEIERMAEQKMAMAMNDVAPAAGEEESDFVVVDEPQEEPEAVATAEQAVEEVQQQVEQIAQAGMEAGGVLDMPAGQAQPEYIPGLSEAQRQERMLQQQLEQGMEPVAVVAKRSEDPYAPIEVEKPADMVAAAAPVEVEEIIEEPVEVAVVEPEAAPQNAAEFNEAMEKELNEAIEQAAAEQEAVEMASAASAIPGAPKSLEQETVAPVKAPGAFHPAFAVENMLSQASITADAVNVVAQASGPNQIVHQWRADNVYGSAEQKPMRSEADFENYVRDYLTKTESRCTGEFAIVPDTTAQYGQTRVDSYEVACVGDAVSSSASILFFNKDGTFTAMAHEAPTTDMETAMALRDRLMNAVSGT